MRRVAARGDRRALRQTWRMRGIHVRVSQRPDASQRALSCTLVGSKRWSAFQAGPAAETQREILSDASASDKREGSLVSEPQKMRGAPKGRKRRSETGSTSGIGTTAAHLSKTFGLVF